MNICLCGGTPGYPHEYACPYPLYRGTQAQYEAWERTYCHRLVHGYSMASAEDVPAPTENQTGESEHV